MTGIDRPQDTVLNPSPTTVEPASVTKLVAPGPPCAAADAVRGPQGKAEGMTSLNSPSPILSCWGWINRESRWLLDAVARSYQDLLLLKDGRIGLLFMAGTFLRPQVGLSGALAVAAAYVFRRLFTARASDGNPAPQHWSFANPLLAGLALGAMLAPNWQMACYVAIVGIGTLVLTTALESFFSTYLKLPVLTLPAVLCLTIASAAALRYTNLPIAAGAPLAWLDQFPRAPRPVDAYLRALGAILFVPHPAAGAFFALLLAWRSRILWLLSIAGFAAAVLFRAVMCGAAGDALNFPYNYNFPLVAMLLGGVVFVPSWKSYAAAVLAAVSAAVMLDFTAAWWTSGVSPLFLPFNLTALGYYYGLSVMGALTTPRVLGETPEETLQIDLTQRYRTAQPWRTLQLPFFGRWQVWQGFSGDWTHQGAGRYAYDFVIADDEGRTFQGGGLERTDYHCWRKPVVAPVRSLVAQVVDHLPDNEPGHVDQANRFGNYVMLYDDRGFYVLLAHLAQGTVKVAAGARVEAGTVLGLCGNSGFSPQPHLHIQVQATAWPESATVPFRFIHFRQGTTWEPAELLHSGAVVENASLDITLLQRFELLLDDHYAYDVFRHGQKVGRLQLDVRIAPDGTLYLQSGRGAKLYFGKAEGNFWFYRQAGEDPHLKLLWSGLPRLPLHQSDLLEWRDRLPASVLAPRRRRWWLQLLGAVAPEFDQATCTLRFIERDRIHSQSVGRFGGVHSTAEIWLDEQKLPAQIRLGDWELRRTQREQPPPTDAQRA